MGHLKALLLLGLAWCPLTSRAQPPLWHIDYQHSKLEFVTRQAGAEFTGGFHEFQAEIRFTESDLAKSTARVSVNMASVDTHNGERDANLTAADWFDVDSFPVASFVVQRFARKQDGGYRASADLTIRDVKQAVNFDFRVEHRPDGIHLLGEVLLNRLVFGLGTGDWADGSLIGLQVKVKVTLHATELGS